MRFFKYLILFTLSPFANAAYQYDFQGGIKYPTPEAACAAYSSSDHFIEQTYPGNPDLVGTCSGAWIRRTGTPECPPVGYPAYFHQGSNGEIPTVRCLVVSGVKCKYVDRGEQPIWITMSGGSTPTRTLYSASSMPDPHCADQDNGSCNKNDPYSGCYVPPNDKCLRHADGSISCPDNDPPPINNTCNGATYCDRPPEGCGTGYVSGSFNGRALCVKSGTGTGGDGTGTGSSSSTSSSTSSSSSNSSSSSSNSGNGGGDTIVNNTNNNTNNITNNTTVNIDVSSIVNAINNLKNSMNPLLTDINNSVKSVSSTLSGTNQKLDTANTTLNSINQKNQVTNDKLQELINKPTGTSQGNSDDSGIIDSVNSFKDKFIEFFGTERDTSDLEQIGQETNDPRSNSAQDNASSAFQNLANVLTFSSSACVPDLEINNIPLFHSVVIPLSKWCDLLAMVKILLHLGVLLTALRMVTDTVRVI